MQQPRDAQGHDPPPLHKVEEVEEVEVEENCTGLSSTAFLNPNLGTNTFARMGASSGLSEEEEGPADIGAGGH